MIPTGDNNIKLGSMTMARASQYIINKIKKVCAPFKTREIKNEEKVRRVQAQRVDAARALLDTDGEFAKYYIDLTNRIYDDNNIPNPEQVIGKNVVKPLENISNQLLMKQGADEWLRRSNYDGQKRKPKSGDGEGKERLHQTIHYYAILDKYNRGRSSNDVLDVGQALALYDADAMWTDRYFEDKSVIDKLKDLAVALYNEQDKAEVKKSKEYEELYNTALCLIDGVKGTEKVEAFTGLTYKQFRNRKKKLLQYMLDEFDAAGDTYNYNKLTALMDSKAEYAIAEKGKNVS